MLSCGSLDGLEDSCMKRYAIRVWYGDAYSTAFLVVNKETKGGGGGTQNKHSMAVHKKGTGLMPRVEETEDDDVKRGDRD